MFFRSRPWDELVYWALDLETSSLDPATGVVLSVGMVPVRHGVIRWGERYYSLVRPPTPEAVATDAITIHHILPEELLSAPDLSLVMLEVDERLADCSVLLVHHAPFDVGFLRRAYQQFGRKWPKPPVVDTQALAARIEQRRHILEPYARPLPRGLAELRSTFGLPPFETHHALSDALATAELFLAMRARLEAKTLRHIRRR
jgi:DNA polymerase-3 subunit epsilon